MNLRMFYVKLKKQTFFNVMKFEQVLIPPIISKQCLDVLKKIYIHFS